MKPRLPWVAGVLPVLAMAGACQESGTSPGTSGVSEMRIVVHYDTHIGPFDFGYQRSPISETSYLVLRIDSASSTAMLSGPDSRCNDAIKASVTTTGDQITIDFTRYSTSSFLHMSGTRQPDGSFRGTAKCQERPGPHSASDEGTFVLESSQMAPRPLVFLPANLQVKVHDTVRITPAIATPPGAPGLGAWEFAFDSATLTFLPPDRFVAVKSGSTVVRVISRGEEQASTTVAVTFPSFTVFPDTVVMLPGHDVQLNLQSFTYTEGLKKYAVSKWSSSDASVATVDASGIVRAVGTGTTLISAERDGFVLSGTVIVQPPHATRFKAIAQSFHRTCALDDSGQPWCWGRVEPITGPVSKCEYMLGSGPASQRQVVHCARFPVRVSGLRFKSLTDGSEPTGLTEDGALYRFDAAGPVLLASGYQFASAVNFSLLTCGVLTNASGVCWGFTANGSSGDGSAKDLGPYPSTPQPLSGSLAWSDITLGCGLTTGGEAYCWGANDRGRLGVGTDSTVRTGCSQACVLVPTKVLSASTYTSIAAGDFDFCAITSQGTTHCWGSIPRSSAIPIASGGRPVEVVSPSFSRVFRAGKRICGYDLERRVHCMVKNVNAASYAAQFSFVQLMIPFTVRALAQSEYDYAPCAISDEDEAVYCWGNREFGRLGDGTTAGIVLISAPVKVAGQP